jgi:hypothetical protein
MNDVKRIYSRISSLWLSLGMALLLIGGITTSVILGSFIPIEWLGLALAAVGSLASIGALGTFAVQALRVGVYISGHGDLAVHSIGVTRTVRLDAVAGVIVYHGYSSHGRFYAPAILVDLGEGRQRLLRLWWLASGGEDVAKRWANELTRSINDARSRLLSRGAAEEGPDRGLTLT